MRIALLAADIVGLEVARFFGRTSEPLGCLVVDAADPKSLNGQIIDACGLQDKSRIFTSEQMEDPEVNDQFRRISLDLGLLAWWPYILRNPVLRLPRLGFLNFHPSLLPYGRGKDPNFWAIVDQAPFGVTIHWVDNGIDSGEIVFQAQIPVSWEDTGETLHRKAQERIVELFIENYQRLKNGDIPRLPQPESQATFHRRKDLDPASRIDLDRPYRAREILNLLRARTFPPHPGCWFEEVGERFQVRVHIERTKSGKDRNE